MGLSSDLIAQFVKATKDDQPKKSEATVYGTVKVSDGNTYVNIDGSTVDTPVSTAADVKDGDRVIVMIKDHSAIITGNISSPAARTEDVKENSNLISEFGHVIAHKVTAEDLEAMNATLDRLSANFAKVTNLEVLVADVNNLKAKLAEIEYLDADEIKAIKAEIGTIEAKFGTFTDISTEDFTAISAEIGTLKGHAADLTYVTAERLEALKAELKEVYANYAQIDFANINEAAIKKIIADSGFFGEIIAEDQSVTHQLIAVKINGDLIEAGTLKADTLVVKGPDGLYYKLNVEGGAIASETVTEDDLQNGLHGSIIVAESVTADKISVSDLSAFRAKIGGFNISDHAIYSDGKTEVHSVNEGLYMDKSGQISIGSSERGLRYYLDEETGKYVFEIMTGGKTIEEAIDDEIDKLGITLDDTGLTVGKTKNKVLIDDDEVSILVDNVPVQRFTGDGKAVIPDANVERSFSMTGYRTEMDANGLLNCDWIGAEPVILEQKTGTINLVGPYSYDEVYVKVEGFYLTCKWEVLDDGETEWRPIEGIAEAVTEGTGIVHAILPVGNEPGWDFTNVYRCVITDEDDHRIVSEPITIIGSAE